MYIAWHLGRLAFCPILQKRNTAFGQATSGDVFLSHAFVPYFTPPDIQRVTHLTNNGPFYCCFELRGGGVLGVLTHVAS